MLESSQNSQATPSRWLPFCLSVRQTKLQRTKSLHLLIAHVGPTTNSISNQDHTAIRRLPGLSGVQDPRLKHERFRPGMQLSHHIMAFMLHNLKFARNNITNLQGSPQSPSSLRNLQRHQARTRLIIIRCVFVDHGLSIYRQTHRRESKIRQVFVEHTTY